MSKTFTCYSVSTNACLDKTNTIVVGWCSSCIMLCKQYNRRKRIIFSSSNKHHGEIITAGGCISVLCQQECLPTFCGLITKILSLCQPNDQVRNIFVIAWIGKIIAYVHDFEREYSFDIKRKTWKGRIIMHCDWWVNKNVTSIPNDHTLVLRHVTPFLPNKKLLLLY